MCSLRRVLLLLTALVVLPASAYAQASISGVIKDASGAVLPGVTVEAASPVLIEKVRSAVTDGTRPVPHRQPAARHLFGDVHAAGIQHVRREGIELTGCFTADVNADLKVGGVAETITVSGETPDRRHAEHPASDHDQQRAADVHSRRRARGQPRRC